jgi:hypothetical protein
MVVRTAKLYGKIGPEDENSTVIAKVSFGNIVVYHGPAIPESEQDEYGASVLASWDFDSSIQGIVPVKIEVSGGSLTLVNILMNHVGGPTKSYTLTQDIDWPSEPSGSLEDLVADYNDFSEEDFFERYGVNKNIVTESVSMTIEKHGQDIFEDPNSNFADCDGKANVVINEVPQARDLIEVTNLVGEWHWPIPNNGVLTCDFVVEPPVFKDLKQPEDL